METENSHNAKYGILKASKHGRPMFVNMADDDATQVFRNQYSNRDLFISTWHSATPNLSAPRNYSFYFHVVSDDPETTHVSALETSYYIAENFNIPAERMEIIYSGGGEIGNNISSKNSGSGSNSANEYNTTAEIVISILPVVFDGQGF